MINNIIITSPLEQFQILPIVPLVLGYLDVSITNVTVIATLTYALTYMLGASMLAADGSLYIIPSVWQSFVEGIYKTVLNLVLDNIKHHSAERYFPLIFFIFCLILSFNLIGLIPYSFTITSHLIFTFSLSSAIFIGINIILIKTHREKALALFMPTGTLIALGLLLVPIEMISHIFKPVSLAVRLFANMMAGHTLLKVIVGFAYKMMGAASSILSAMHIIPLIVLIPLFGLEFGVAIIQAFIFSILVCIYLNESLLMH